MMGFPPHPLILLTQGRNVEVPETWGSEKRFLEGEKTKGDGMERGENEWLCAVTEG